MDATPTITLSGGNGPNLPGGWSRWPRPLRRALVLAGGIVVFTLVASVVNPRASSASDEREAGVQRGARASAPERVDESRRAETQGALLSRRHPKGWACLGLMEGAEYYVLIYGSPEGPRYTVCTLSGRTLQSDLPADDVYRAFPTVDVEGMRLEPAVLPTAPDGPALMLADPQD